MHANQPAVALFERAASALPSAPLFNRSLQHADLDTMIANIAHELGYLVNV
jgi:hypothetical protein